MRVPAPLLESMRGDLERPHPFADERVGFLLVGQSPGRRETLLMARKYISLPDAEYIEDHGVGARIGEEAIRTAMRHALAGEGVFHVHMHAEDGRPAFSCVDVENLAELIPAFCKAAPALVHGALLLSNDSGIAQAWTRHGDENGVPVERISIVGSPLHLWEGRS